MNVTTLVTRRFEFIAGTSYKFWTVTVQGNDVAVCYGRIGNTGQRLVKTLPDPTVAAQYAARLIAGKIAKGYREVA